MSKWTTNLKRKIGRFLGQTKKKAQGEDIAEVYDEWKALCQQNGVKPTERVLDLMTWDLKEGGVELTQVKQARKAAEVQEAFDNASLSMEVNKMAKKFASEQIKTQQDLQEALAKQRQAYEKEMEQMARDIQKMKQGRKKQKKPKKELSEEERREQEIQQKVYG